MKLSCSAKKKQPPPDPSPEAGLEAQGGKPSKTFQTLNPLQNPPGPPKPSRHLPNRHPRAKATSQSGLEGQGLSSGFLLALQSCRLPARKHSKRSKTLQVLEAGHRKHSREAPGLEACFEQVAQGLWLVRRVHRRSKTISLPGRLELATLRLTASRSNQPSHGSLCRRPKLVPVLEKRLNNSWLQMVCQTKGQRPT